MLHSKDKVIISELKTFFSSAEKSVITIYDLLSSLTLSEKRLGLQSPANNTYRNINKLLLLFLFPLFDLDNISQHKNSVLFKLMASGKDVFYRLVNNSNLPWRRIVYNLNKQLFKKIDTVSEVTKQPRCLIVDDTDFHKTGRRVELIGRIFSHVTHSFNLGFKGLFLGLHDGRSFFALDFSLHGEKGKNKSKPQGMSKKDLKSRFHKKREKESYGYQRESEYFVKKTDNMLEMIKRAIKKGIQFNYLLTDSWFTSYKLVKFVKTRHLKFDLLSMGKMGVGKYLYQQSELTAKQILDKLKRQKKLKRSKSTRGCYCEVLVMIKDIEVKLFFHKTTRKGKWHMLITTNTGLGFEQAYRIYTTRWHIEVFFKEAKQYLRMGKNQAQDFDAQIAHLSINIIQYNLLATAKRYSSYETLGELFRGIKQEHIELTIAERIYQIITELAVEIATIFETEVNIIMEKLISDNQRIAKYINLQVLLETG